MNVKYFLNNEFSKKFNNFEEEIIKEFEYSDKVIHKARNELKVIDINGLKLVVKSFKIPNLMNKVIYTFFKKSKAQKSYLNALKLIELNVHTPTPVGYIEKFNFGLINESYFISLLEPYEFSIREVFHHKVDNHEEVLEKFTEFTYNIHKKGIWHVDYSLGNILISQNENEYKFSLVDINRMEFREIPPKEGLKNFNKFWAKDERDLEIVAKKYASLTSFNESEAIKIVKEEAQKVIDFKNKKKKLKKVVGK